MKRYSISGVGIGILMGMLYLYNLDGTLISVSSDHTREAYHSWEVLPGRSARLRGLLKDKHTLGIVAQQEQVGLGVISEDDVAHKLKLVLSQLELPPDTDIHSCYHHPDATEPRYRDTLGCKRRKPSGLMIKEAMAAQPQAASDGVVYVGDGDQDEIAATSAGVMYQRSSAFFI